MKNKVKFKKYLLYTFIISICLLFLFLVINIYEYHVYTTNFNNKISEIVEAVQRKYPNVTKNEIIEILNTENVGDNETFEKYGIDLNEQSILTKNDKDFNKFLIFNMCFISSTIIILLVIFMIYNKRKDKDIAEITKYIEEINKKNNKLDLDAISEDELSILKNEIYKTTIMLKEAAENSNADKLNLKKSLEDISHQLKTPLTSILIMLDNLIDDPNMDINTRNEFIRDIKREDVNINFFVQAILKLSKFDSNTVHFIKEEIYIKDIINESIKNVLALCDLRNINIETKGDDSAKIKCDFKWQIEAVTNILKNCIDHSKDNEKIIIEYEQNNVYCQIKIKDFGDGISKEDLPHVFERFYKGKNSNFDSIGIGLSLSKTIIEEDNGNISVSSDDKGTEFVIKYWK